jgi:UDP-N-acetylglucosamine acyltransferase
MISIHPTAIVDPQAIIAEGCTIGPYAIIGPEVVMGEDCEVHSHAVITGKTTLGKKNRIFYHACVGGIPQDKKYHGETAELVIGDNNLIREYCTINTGSAKDEGGITRVGNDNWIMAYVHIAHNCNRD